MAKFFPLTISCFTDPLSVLPCLARQYGSMRRELFRKVSNENRDAKTTMLGFGSIPFHHLRIDTFTDAATAHFTSGDSVGREMTNADGSTRALPGHQSHCATSAGTGPKANKRSAGASPSTGLISTLIFVATSPMEPLQPHLRGLPSLIQISRTSATPAAESKASAVTAPALFRSPAKATA